MEKKGNAGNGEVRSVLFFYLRGRSTQEEQNNVGCSPIEAGNLFSHPNQDALWSCQHEMHTSLLACRKILLPLCSLSVLVCFVCVCVFAVHVMDDRAVSGRSWFNCDVSACLWQPPAVSSDRRECVDVCLGACVVSGVRLETTEELWHDVARGFSARPRPPADSQETGLRSLFSCRLIGCQASSIILWKCHDRETNWWVSPCMLCVFVSSGTWENMILTSYISAYSCWPHHYFITSNHCNEQWKNTSTFHNI